ncbi:hypothetical protein [Methylovulum psychrotolerans]|jgi:hypothetical protein|uniref:Uncharacterized protein n=1 Tax=Methylovulum psychrotolerans TaxID=1704499 RepID=A0A2S5CHL0_9GAMM|nr:hypothetical protein [Methylovulum psychrotolerans]POZ50303.1 hypothetical protein AADEFJLK_03887 [Methylovulum psychrotolerans]
MITSEKIKIYAHYYGDSDMWARRAKSSEKAILSNDWYLIGSLIQEIELVNKGLASEKFTLNLKKHLIESCDNQETIRQLESLLAMNK